MLLQGSDEILPAVVGHVEVGIGGLEGFLEQVRGELPHDFVPEYVGTGDLVDVEDAIVGGVIAEVQEFAYRLRLPGGQGQAQLVADYGLPPQEVSLLDPEDDFVQHLAEILMRQPASGARTSRRSVRRGRSATGPPGMQVWLVSSVSTGDDLSSGT